MKKLIALSVAVAAIGISACGNSTSPQGFDQEAAVEKAATCLRQVAVTVVVQPQQQIEGSPGYHAIAIQAYFAPGQSVRYEGGISVFPDGRIVAVNYSGPSIGPALAACVAAAGGEPLGAFEGE